MLARGMPECLRSTSAKQQLASGLICAALCDQGRLPQLRTLNGAGVPREETHRSCLSMHELQDWVGKLVRRTWTNQAKYETGTLSFGGTPQRLPCRIGLPCASGTKGTESVIQATRRGDAAGAGHASSQ